VIHDRWIEAYSSSNIHCNNNNNKHANSNDNSDNQESKDSQSNQQQEQRNSSNFKIEDLQYRYYSVAAILTQSRISQQAAAEAQALSASSASLAGQHRNDGGSSTGNNNPSNSNAGSNDNKAVEDQLLVETAAARALASSDPVHQPLLHNLGAGTSNKVFDLRYERGRRAHMEALWKRSKEDELEEASLRKELKEVEAQIRKIKKSGGHILAAAAAKGAQGRPGKAGLSGNDLSNNKASALSRNTSALGSSSAVQGGSTNSLSAADPPPGALLDDAFTSTAPKPMPKIPYLQSGRLEPPATGGSTGLNKALLSRMDTLLEEMKVPKQPLPTKRVCDVYYNVRKDALTLLILEKNVLQKEGILESRRLKLAKLGGNIRVVDEETLLGIAPPQPPPASSSGAGAQGSSSGRGKGGGAKRKSASGGSRGKSGGGAASKSGGADDASTKKQQTKAAAPGGKQQGRKSVTKRKRKSAGVTSPVPPHQQGGTAAAARQAQIASASPKPAQSAGSTAGLETSGDTAKPPGKKRARKNA